MKKGLAVLAALVLLASPATADEPADVPVFFSKRISETKVKIYAKDIVGIGKVQFLFGDEEVAWVRATSSDDPKLRSYRGVSYLVRTITLRPGRNTVEIAVEGGTAWKKSYVR